MPERRPATPSLPEFFSPGDLPTPAGFSQAVSIPSGRLVWVSGQLGVDVDGRVPPGSGWQSQTRLAFENVARALRAADAGWRDVVKLTLFVVDLSELATIRAVRDEFVDTAHPPTSSLVQVAGLVRPGALIEIEAVARVA
jgi:enamine deaminase RidA (YjgF/YER057c/UK114 family)